MLGACTSDDEKTSSTASSAEGISAALTSAAESSVACKHVYGDAPTETVGNLDIYECIHCGERKVVANGTLIGGE